MLPCGAHDAPARPQGDRRDVGALGQERQRRIGGVLLGWAAQQLRPLILCGRRLGGSRVIPVRTETLARVFENSFPERYTSLGRLAPVDCSACAMSVHESGDLMVFKVYIADRITTVMDLNSSHVPEVRRTPPAAYTTPTSS